MNVFKFGGAALQDPSVIHSIPLLIQEVAHKPLVLVVSAMGNITRQLEAIFQQYLHHQPYQQDVERIYYFHLAIAQSLLTTSLHQVETELNSWKEVIMAYFQEPFSSNNIEQKYCQLIAWGELLSSKIVYQYLIEATLPCIQVDIRNYIKTKSGFMNAKLNKYRTNALLRSHFIPFLKRYPVILTQGFIASNETGHTTTLGKEGSDFTGAIIAAALRADSLTIWKDVPGVMNIDPILSSNAVQFKELSYEKMAAMSFYGAQVVHPKTIAPLAEKNIPLYIRSFKDKQAASTKVSNHITFLLDEPIYIIKKDQLWVELSIGSFAFFEVKLLKAVFKSLVASGLQINFLQKTPYALLLCVNDDGIQSIQWLDLIKTTFNLTKWVTATLLTIMGKEKNFQQDLTGLLKGKKILAKQYTETVCQIVFT